MEKQSQNIHQSTQGGGAHSVECTQIGGEVLSNNVYFYASPDNNKCYSS
jgi:hypothetical protein